MKAAVLAVVLVAALVVACAATTESAPPPAAPTAAQEEDGWKAFGHALTLAQVLMRNAAQSDDPEKGVDDVLAGRNTEANQAITGLLEEATADMPAQYRSRVASIGQDVAALARKQMARPPAASASADRALQARKDLTAMGLKYHDPNDFLEAVKRDDALAVALFVEGRGVNLGAKDAQGRTALEIARARGNQPLAQLLSRNLPAAR